MVFNEEVMIVVRYILSSLFFLRVLLEVLKSLKEEVFVVDYM